MTRVQLASDKSQQLSKHVEELTQRSLLILLFWTIAAIIIATQIDNLLSILLFWLSPCANSECLNIYEPATWSGTRWSMVGLLSLIATSPIILQQTLQFASPGLFPDERRWLKYWFIGTWLISMLMILVTVIWLLPAFFSVGHGTQSDMGFSARYDASRILGITFLVILAQVVVYAACLWVLLGSKLGVIDLENIGWWRLRVHGFTIGILVLLVQSVEPSILLVLVALCAWLLELCFSTANKSKFSSIDEAVYLDSKDGEHKFLLLDCKCLGAMNKDIGDMMIPKFSSEGMCASANDQDLLLQGIIRERFTDVIVTGCDSKPLPARLHSSANLTGCKIHGLELMDNEMELENAWSEMKSSILFGQ